MARVDLGKRTFVPRELVRVAPKVDFSSVELTAEEGFLLSRVDSVSTVETLCLVTGLGKETTLEILGQLRAKGLILVGDDDPGQGKREASSSAPRRPQDIFLPEDEDTDLKPEIRKQIRFTHGRLQELNMFELLEVSPFDDFKKIRASFFKKSKEYHPDRYYGKKLGPYKEMMEEVFKQTRAAYKLLENEEKRESYRSMLIKQKEQEALARQVEENAARLMEKDRAAGAPDMGESHEYLFIKKRRRRRRRSLMAIQAEKALKEMIKPPGGARKASIQPDDLARQKRREEDKKRRSTAMTGAFFDRAKRAQEFFEQGTEQLVKEQFLAASASLKLAITYNPDDPRFAEAYALASEKAREVLADNYFRQALFEESVGRFEAAGNHFVKAAEQRSKGVYCQRAAEYLLAFGDLIRAKDYATKAVRNDPASVENRLVLAKVYYAANLMKNARRELQEALKIEPGNSDVKELLKKVR